MLILEVEKFFRVYWSYFSELFLNLTLPNSPWEMWISVTCLHSTSCMMLRSHCPSLKQWFSLILWKSAMKSKSYVTIKQHLFSGKIFVIQKLITWLRILGMQKASRLTQTNWILSYLWITRLTGCKVDCSKSLDHLQKFSLHCWFCCFFFWGWA